MLKNIDNQHNVLAVTSPRENFAFDLSFSNSVSKRRKRSTSPDVGPFTIVMFGNTSDGLGVNASKSFSGSVQFLIPRDKCSSLHFLCGSVSTGTNASYAISGTNPISCIDFDPLKNCAGMLLHSVNYLCTL